MFLNYSFVENCNNEIKQYLDAHRALELLEDYCTRLTSPNDKQLRIAIEKVIYIFKSSLFQALLGNFINDETLAVLFLYH